MTVSDEIIHRIMKFENHSPVIRLIGEINDIRKKNNIKDSELLNVTLEIPKSDMMEIFNLKAFIELHTNTRLFFTEQPE